MRHDQSVDGLRGIAAMGVVVSHFFAAYVPILLHAFYPAVFRQNHHPDIWFSISQIPPLTVLYNGHFAVIVFFVISGYVLAMPYYAGRREKLFHRLAGRYFRLNLPVAVSILISYAIFLGHGYYNVPASVLSHSTWLQTNLPASGFTPGAMLSASLYKAILGGDTTFNTPLWSIRVEFVGSLLLLAYFLLKPKGWSLMSGVLLVLILGISFRENALFYIAIFLGALLNAVKFPAKALWAAFALGVYFGGYAYGHALYNFLPDVDLWETKTFYNTLGAVLLVGAVVNGFFRNFLESSPIQFFGKISYAIYLLHFLVLYSFSCFLYISLPPTIPCLVLNLLLYVAVVLLLAIGFEKYVDQAAIRLAHHIGDYLCPRPSLSTKS